MAEQITVETLLQSVKNIFSRLEPYYEKASIEEVGDSHQPMIQIIMDDPIIKGMERSKLTCEMTVVQLQNAYSVMKEYHGRISQHFNEKAMSKISTWK